MIVGEKVRAKKQTYWMRKENKTRTVWHPMIYFDEQFVYLPDESTPSGLMEANSAIEARQIALKMRDEANTKLLEATT